MHEAAQRRAPEPGRTTGMRRTDAQPLPALGAADPLGLEATDLARLQPRPPGAAVRSNPRFRVGPEAAGAPRYLSVLAIRGGHLARVGVIDRSGERPPCARRCRIDRSSPEDTSRINPSMYA